MSRRMCCCPRPINLLLICALLIFSGCTGTTKKERSEGAAEKSNRVVAVSYPLFYLTTRIAGDALTIEYPAADAEDPRNWQPKISQIAEMQKADLIITNGPGIDYANWLIKVTLPDSKICPTSVGLALKDFIKVKGPEIVHSHGPEGEHSHPFMVAYSWLDPAIAKKQAMEIAKRLGAVYPEHADKFSARSKELFADLDALTAELVGLKSKDAKVASTNPNTKFLTRAAGISETGVMWNEIPDGSNEQEIHSYEKPADAPGHVLTTQTPSDKLEEFAQTNSKSIVKIDLLDKRAADGDYLSVMRENIAKLKSINE